ncbi:DUF167 domain-containing protein [Candidatus Methanocrinis natronophilus]|uniref:UPF0235 protein P0O15_04045 n=1 Tax=Candidatus Methanocrinis natronophilus TaxID=3033396 RepID=A0ABT5X6L3_9EURY|nr:DUF167 family protein [Candidatus Methanocrinis natronophilus]MDF0590343.1 DUF167 family protein [Candidatus Methanocrinis natronophilus]
MEAADLIRKAIDPHPKGVLIRFEVAPGSKKLVLPSGFNPWRRSMEAKLTEEPTGGKANRQLERALCDLFVIGADRVQVTAGKKSPRKVVMILGVDAEEAERVLSEAREGVP